MSGSVADRATRAYLDVASRYRAALIRDGAARDVVREVVCDVVRAPVESGVDAVALAAVRLARMGQARPASQVPVVAA